MDFNSGQDAIPGSLIVGVDVLGGGFVINGGDLGCGEPGEVCYLAPDDLEWMPCEMGHSAFVRWALGGDVAGFYEELRWPGWEEQVAALAPGEGIGVFPPPFTREGRGPDVVRRPVPLLEAWGLMLSFAAQIRGGGAEHN
jgi:hypothetical protein